MATRRRTLILPSVAVMLVLAGCNSGSTLNVQNPPPPPPSNLSIAFQPAPAASVAVGSTENLTAVVSNDPNNYGVDWALACPSSVSAGNCGSISLQHTDSGSPTTYTPPLTLSSNSMSGVSIVAYATADHTTNQVATFSVNSFDTNLKAGNYVLQAQGTQVGNPYQVVAVISLDGQGNVTAGEQTLNAAINLESVSDSINPVGSYYFVGNDGRGIITLNDSTFGSEVFSCVFLNNGPENPQALISQTGIDNTGATAVGTMELQTAIAPPTGSYSFVTSGIATQLGHTLPIVLGGIVSIDSNNNISGLGDEIFGRELTLNGTALCVSPPCTVSSADAFGQVIVNLTPGFGFHNHQISVQFTGYIVDTTHIRLIESDYISTNLTPFGLTGGLAVAQSSGSANNFAPSSVFGPYVFGVAGVDLSGGNITPSTLTSVGVFSADGNSDVTNGFTDTFLLFNSAQGTQNNPQTGAQISATFGGTYAVDQTGRATLSLDDFMPVPKPTYAPALILYLTDSQNPGLALVLAGMPQAPPPAANFYPSLGAGIAYPRSTASSAFGGDYGFSITQVSGGGENDATAQMNVNTANTPAVSGLADSTLAPPPPNDPNLPDHTFAGTVSSPLSNGVFDGSFLDVTSGLPFAVGNNTENNNFAVDYYSIDPVHGFFVETDLVNTVPPATPPAPSAQVSFGYYVTRVPLCSGCP